MLPVAELDSAGNVEKRYRPGYIVKNDATYKMVRDHLGSVRIVVNSETGEVVQRIDYDAWGNITHLQNQDEFTDIGFAGGLYDKDTGLIRFGARDYDPRTGRWTSKDPILFDGGTSNLYEYVLNDPMNLVDPDGNCPIRPPEKINYHSASPQEIVNQILNYLTYLQNKNAKQGNLLDIFNYTTNSGNVRGGGEAPLVGMKPVEGTTTIDGNKVSVSIFIGTPSSIPLSDAVTTFTTFVTRDPADQAAGRNNFKFYTPEGRNYRRGHTVLLFTGTSQRFYNKYLSRRKFGY